MKKKNIRNYYTLEKVLKLAKKCCHYSEFRKKYARAYYWLCSRKLQSKVKFQQKSPPRPTIYTKEKVIEIAKSCKNKKEFRDNYSGVYAWTYKNNCVKEISDLIPETQRPKKHTKEIAFKIAKQYKDFGSFSNERSDIESFLKRNGLFKEATKHIKSKINYRTKQDKL